MCGVFVIFVGDGFGVDLVYCYVECGMGFG